MAISITVFVILLYNLATLPSSGTTILMTGSSVKLPDLMLLGSMATLLFGPTMLLLPLSVVSLLNTISMLEPLMLLFVFFLSLRKLTMSSPSVNAMVLLVSTRKEIPLPMAPPPPMLPPLLVQASLV